MLKRTCRNLTPGTDRPWGRLAEPLVTASLPHRKLGHHYRHNFILELNKLAKAWWPWKLPPPVNLGLEHTQVGLGLDHAVERSWKKGDPEDAGGDLEGLVEAGAEGPEFADPGAEGPEAAGLSAERGTGRDGEVSRRLKRTHWRPWPLSRPCLSLGKPQTFWK